MNPITDRTRLPPSRLRKLPGWRCRALAGSPLWSMLDRGAWPPDIADPRRITTLKRNPRNHSGLLHLPDGAKLFFKRFPRRGLVARLARRRARTNWQLSRHLERHGVGVARAEALLEGRTEDWFLAEELPARQSLARLSKQHQLPASDWLQTALAASLAGLHRAGVSHGDLKWGNILLDDLQRIRLVDLDSARHDANPNRADEDLARCLVSALELGFDRDWAQGLIRHYAGALEQPADPLLQRLRPLVGRISRSHARRYRRPPVAL